MTKAVRGALLAVVGTNVFALFSHLGGMCFLHEWFGSNTAYSVSWWILWLIDTPVRVLFALTGTASVLNMFIFVDPSSLRMYLFMLL